MPQVCITTAASMNTSSWKVCDFLPLVKLATRSRLTFLRALRT